MKYSLRIKILIPVLLLASSIFMGAQYYNVTASIAHERIKLIERVNVLVAGIIINVKSALVAGDSQYVHRIMSILAVEHSVVQAKLYQKNGALFASYQNTNDSDISMSVFKPSDTYFVNEDPQHLHFSFPIYDQDAVIGRLDVLAAKRSLNPIYNQQLSDTIIFVLGLLLSGCIFYLVIQKVVIKPVTRLSKAMNQSVNRHQRALLDLPKSNDEIGELAKSFVVMLDRLATREHQVSYVINKLEVEKSLAHNVIESVRYALLVVNADGTIHHYNSTILTLFELEAEQVSGQTIATLFQCDVFDIGQLITQSHTQNPRWTIKCDRSNQQKVVVVSASNLQNNGQSLICIEDMTAAEMARDQESLAARVFENSHDALMVVNQDGLITMVNASISVLLGYSRSELIGQKPVEAFAWRQLSELMATIYESVTNYGQWQGEVWEAHKMGHKVPMFVKVSKVNNPLDASQGDYFFMFLDLSNYKEMERLEYLAHHDSLTGLANRTKLHTELNVALCDKRIACGELAILYIDLDGFKLVNDNYGHDAGDFTLKYIANTLLKEVRSQDLVARLSGDEFVIVLKGLDRDAAKSLAQRIINEVERPLPFRQHKLHVSASVGVYVIEDKSMSVTDAIRHADSAMYRAKHMGKGRVVVNYAQV